MRGRALTMLQVVLLICLLLNSCCAMAGGANDNAFDYTVFENREHYKEDRFDKTWEVIEAPLKDELKCTFILDVDGDLTGNLTNICIAFLAIKNSKTISAVTSGQILVDDGRVFTFESSNLYKEYNIDGERVPDFPMMKEDALTFLEAVMETDEIALRINSDEGRFDESFSKDELAGVKEIVRVLLEQNALELFDDSKAQELFSLGAYTISVS